MKKEAPSYILIYRKHCICCKLGLAAVYYFCVLFVGENSIVIVSGANDILSEEDVKNAKSVISSSSVCVCQLEINPEVTHYTLSLAKKAGGECHRKCNFPVFVWGRGGRGGCA